MDQFMKLFASLQAGLYGAQGTGKGNESGATAVEYSMMVVLIAAIIVGTVLVLGLKVDALFARVQLP